MRTPWTLAVPARSVAPMRRSLRWWWVLAGIAILLLPLLLRSAYPQHLANSVALNGILVLSLSLVLSYTGLLSLGHAAFFAVGAYATAILSVTYHWAFWPALLVAVVVSAIFAAIVGLPMLRLSAMYLALATIAVNELVVVVLNNWDALTRGSSGIPNIPPPSLFGARFDSEIPYYYLFLAALALTFWIVRQTVQSPIGRALISIREDALVAQSLGVDATLFRVLSFALGAAFAGLAGGLQASYLSLVSPNSFTTDISLALLAMVVLGGRTLLAPVVGAALLTLLPEVARPLADYRIVTYGLVLVGVMILRPEGLLAPRRPKERIARD
jgi:branched-chain amino acid transport system permease protein